MSSSKEDTNRFTVSDYTDFSYGYGGDEDEGNSNVIPKASTSVNAPPPAVISSRHPLDRSGPSSASTIASSRKQVKRTDTSDASGGMSLSSSGMRPLPRIPSTSTTTSPTSPSPVAGPSSSPTALSSSHSYISYHTAKLPISPSSSTYHTRPQTARTLSKGKQPEHVNATGTQTRPGRNGSGGSSHYKLQLHEVEPSGVLPLGDPLPTPTPSSFTTPPATSRVSTELDPLPSLHHSHSVYSQNMNENHWDDKERDEKDIYAAPTLNRNQSEKKQVGFWRRITPSSWVCRVLLATVIIESLVDLAILANILWRFNHAVKSDQSSELIWQNKRRLPVYLIIFGLAHLWQTILTCIAIKGKNTMQVVAVTIFNYAFLGYAVMMIYELRTILGDLTTSLMTTDPDAPSDEIFTIPLNVLTGVLIGVIAFGSVVLTVLACFVRREFGWQKYRFLGADLQIRKLYQRFQVFECICFFSAFFSAAFGIQFIWLVLQKTDVEYIFTWIMFPLLLLILVFGRFAAIYEKKWMMFTFLFGILCGLAYFIFKLVRIWQQDDTVYSNLSLSLTVFDALSIVSLSACGIWGIWVGLGFSQGLKQAIMPSGGSIVSAMRIWRTKSAETDVEMHEKEKEKESIAMRRISID